MDLAPPKIFLHLTIGDLLAEYADKPIKAMADKVKNNVCLVVIDGWGISNSNFG